jgi:hypothetical protein
MKHRLTLLLLILFGVTSFSRASAAPDRPGFLICDPISNRLELVDPDLKSINRFKIDSKLLKLKRLPKQREYLLLLQGATAKFSKKIKRPGKLVYYNQQFQPAGRQIELPGKVVTEAYLDQANCWLIITTQTNRTVLNLVDPVFGSNRQFELEAPPDLLQLNADAGLLALSIVNDHNRATIKIINLKQATSQEFAVTDIPGALYFGASDQIIVAGSPNPNAPKKHSFWKATPDFRPSSAQLTIIDIKSGQQESLPLGETPVTLIQDRANPAVFYSISTNYDKQSNQTFGADPSERNKLQPVGSTFRVIARGREIVQVKLAAVADRISQAPSGNICLLGQSRFWLFDPHAAKLIAESSTDSKFDSISFSFSGQLGYLSSKKGFVLQLIDLSSGKQLTKITAASPTLLEQLQLTLDWKALFSNNGTAAVSGVTNIQTNQPILQPSNRQIAIDEGRNRIFRFSKRSKLGISDLKTGQSAGSVKFNDNALGLHLIPHSDYITVVTKKVWYLIDPQKSNPILTVRLDFPGSDADGVISPPKSYYSPDGALLAIFFNQQLYLVKTAPGQLLGKKKTKAQNPSVFWL